MKADGVTCASLFLGENSQVTQGTGSLLVLIPEHALANGEALLKALQGLVRLSLVLEEHASVLEGRFRVRVRITKDFAFDHLYPLEVISGALGLVSL